MMTDQEAFDKMVAHLRAQGERATVHEDGGLCALHGAGGKMCAVGCLIPDSEYEAKQESYTLDDLHVEVPQLRVLSFRLLDEMRDVHDFTDPDEWEFEFPIVADKLGLDYKENNNEAHS